MRLGDVGVLVKLSPKPRRRQQGSRGSSGSLIGRPGDLACPGCWTNRALRLAFHGIGTRDRQEQKVKVGFQQNAEERREKSKILNAKKEKVPGSVALT